MTTDQILVLGRVMERILTCLFGGVSLFLGWNLFRVGILDHQSAALSAHGWRVDLKRVGPGIFFALFGAAVLAISIHSPLTIEAQKPTPVAAGDVASKINYDIGKDPAIKKQWVASINTILTVATGDKSGDSQKAAMGRAAVDLKTLRNTLVISQFGPDRFAEYQREVDRFSRDPDSFDSQAKQRLTEIAEWMSATRNLE